MDIPKAVDGTTRPPPLLPIFAQGEFEAAPGGRPVGFPTGIEREVFRQIVPEGQGISREEFNRRYPEPSYTPAIQDTINGLKYLYRKVSGAPDPDATPTVDEQGGPIVPPQAADGNPVKPPIIVVYVDP